MAGQDRPQVQTLGSTKTLGKTWYMITSPHTVQECMDALNHVADMGQQSIAQWRWGCMAGDHTGYAFVHAESPEQALKMVPEDIRHKAHVERVNEFSIDEIKNMHIK